MLQQTPYRVPKELLELAVNSLPSDDFRHTINEPTGNFFYDSWKIKDEYKGTVWEQLLSALPDPIGEARIILLEPGKCYQSHADIDDRYHLNLSGTQSFLINIEREHMEKLKCDGVWYHMNAGYLHSAVNFGRTVRAQLVVRDLLVRNTLTDPVPITIVSNGIGADQARFVFDNTLSPWLNFATKAGTITDFNPSSTAVHLTIERKFMTDLFNLLPPNFGIE